MEYKRIRTHSADDHYKKFLGGGASQWQSRGLFQLDFMKLVGLGTNNSLLDIGCGPGRGGIHLIRYLNEEKYFGFDFNIDFIKIFQETVLKEKLSKKRASIRCVDDFLPGLPKSKTFDYAVAFSVLNHANRAQKAQFFANIPGLMSQNGRVFVTHGGWFADKSSRFQTKFRLLREIGPELIDPKKYGWRQHETIYPILEFGL